MCIIININNVCINENIINDINMCILLLILLMCVY